MKKQKRKIVLREFKSDFNKDIFRLRQLAKADGLLEASQILWKHTEGQTDEIRRFVVEVRKEILACAGVLVLHKNPALEKIKKD